MPKAIARHLGAVSRQVAVEMSSRKAQASSTMKIVIVAVVLIAIALVAYYWLGSAGKSVKIFSGCTPYNCHLYPTECDSDGANMRPAKTLIMSNKPCKLPDPQDTKKQIDGFCCSEPVI